MRSLTDVLRQAASPRLVQAARAQAILRRWPEFVGEIIAARSQPVRFRNGIAYISVADSSWRQELELRQEEILDRLNAAAEGAGLFKELRVEVGRQRDGFDAVDAEP